MSRASHLLDLTRFAGVVMTPKRRTAFHIGSDLSEKRILLIIVAPDGDVQNCIILTDRAYSPRNHRSRQLPESELRRVDFQRDQGARQDELRKREDMTQLMTPNARGRTG